MRSDRRHVVPVPDGRAEYAGCPFGFVFAPVPDTVFVFAFIPVFAAVLRFRVRLVEGAFRRGLPSIRRIVPLRLMRGYISTSRMPCRCRLRFERTLRTD